MMAALTAAGDRQNRVVLLERQARAGRKLNATGNGRCNLTNMTASPRNYHGEDADFVRFALDGFPPEAVVEAFESEGFAWGGKWELYDPMHFEYRPELFEMNKVLATLGGDGAGGGRVPGGS